MVASSVHRLIAGSTRTTVARTAEGADQHKHKGQRLAFVAMFAALPGLAHGLPPRVRPWLCDLLRRSKRNKGPMRNDPHTPCFPLSQSVQAVIRCVSIRHRLSILPPRGRHSRASREGALSLWRPSSHGLTRGWLAVQPALLSDGAGWTKEEQAAATSASWVSPRKPLQSRIHYRGPSGRPTTYGPFTSKSGRFV